MKKQTLCFEYTVDNSSFMEVRWAKKVEYKEGRISLIGTSYVKGFDGWSFKEGRA